MAIHIKCDETDWLVRDFARRRGLGITAAIKLAIQEASDKEQAAVEHARHRMEPVWNEIRAMKSDEPHSHRKLVDDAWEGD